MAANSKRPTWTKAPEPKKNAAIREHPAPGNGPFSWKFEWSDKMGRWPWPPDDADGHLSFVIGTLKDIEGMTRTQLIARGCHPVKPEKLIKDAADRLATIHRDDYDEYWSLRLTGKRRVWAIATDNIMHVLWWDPQHEVCPSLKS